MMCAPRPRRTTPLPLLTRTPRRPSSPALLAAPPHPHSSPPLLTRTPRRPSSPALLAAPYPALLAAPPHPHSSPLTAPRPPPPTFAGPPPTRATAATSRRAPSSAAACRPRRSTSRCSTSRTRIRPTSSRCADAATHSSMWSVIGPPARPADVSAVRPACPNSGSPTTSSAPFATSRPRASRCRSASAATRLACRRS
jgi:hypothetical protein